MGDNGRIDDSVWVVCDDDERAIWKQEGIVTSTKIHLYADAKKARDEIVRPPLR